MKRIIYPRQKITSTTVKELVHANSIGAGVGASSPSFYWPAVMNTLPPLAGKGTTVLNQSIGGQSISNVPGYTNAMTLTAPSAIDANLSATAHNVLFAHEFINELRLNGINAQAALNAFVSYCEARKAAAISANKKLSIVVCTTTPAGAAPAGEGQSWIDQRMAAIAFCNDWLRKNYRGFSDLLCDVAMCEPFRSMYQQNIWTPAAFAAAQVYNRSDGVANDNTHMGNAGYAILGRIGASTMTRIRIK